MKGLRRAVIVALLALGALAPAASAAIPAPPSKWYKLPGLNAASGAQWVRAYAYSTPPNIVYAGLEGGGVFRSTNGGATWSAFNSGFPNPLTTNVRGAADLEHGHDGVTPAPTRASYKSTGGAWQPHAPGHRGRPGPAEEAQRVRAVARQPHRRQRDARRRLLGRRLQELRRWRHLVAAPRQQRHAVERDRSTGSPRTCPASSTRRRAAASTCPPNQGSTWTRIERRHPGQRLADHDVGVPAAPAASSSRRPAPTASTARSTPA